jgi:hypothetical protein
VPPHGEDAKSAVIPGIVLQSTTYRIEAQIRKQSVMFFSKFDSLAEIEALRAGFKPSSVRSIHALPALVPISRKPASAAAAREDLDVRAEMERRVAARLAGRAL